MNISNKNINFLELYKNEIINFINESQKNFMIKSLLNQCNITAIKILIFLKLLLLMI